MSWSIGLASVMMSLFTVLTIHPFENEVVNGICFPALSVVYAILLCIAVDREEKINERIRTLEKKLEDKEKGGEG